MLKFVKPLLAVAAFGAIATQAPASTVVDGNCVSVADSHGCLFNGNINGNPNPGNANSYLNAQNAYNLYNDTHPTANPDIALTYLGDTNTGFPGTFTGGGTTSGTWSLPGYLVDYVAVKAADKFVLYKLAVAASSGSWNSFDVPGNPNSPALSHLAFFGGPAVPEPATWGLMISGFAIAGSAMRRRKAKLVTA